ncbi:MAG: UDP-N-acetylmuramoyl-L-alanine--D-glutamate ligase [Candidatus Saccharimonadales bacterium]
MSKVAILGFGIEGKSAYLYFKSLDHEITICDNNEDLELPAGVNSQLGANYLDNLDKFDLIIRSPGVLPYSFETKTEVTTVMNEFLARARAKKIIGVTGSKGKGTTTALIDEILKTADLSTFLGGNIGTPPLDFINQVTVDDYVVLEMSNLQLWDIKHSPDIAVLLMITADHMDWHRGNMDEYVAIKGNITKFQDSNGLLIHHPSNEYVLNIARSSKARARKFLDVQSAWVDKGMIMYQTKAICSRDEINLIGDHNLENVCAAIAASWDILMDELGDEAKAITVLKEALKSYQGLPHRLELIAQKGEIRFYDDSIGTTPEATIAAIRAFNEDKALIMGGSDKGTDFDELAKVIAADKQIKSISLIGSTTTKIKKSLLAASYSGELHEVAGNANEVMLKAVYLANSSLAGKGVVLLAPACASFDLFKDYQARGEEFKNAVASI